MKFMMKECSMVEMGKERSLTTGVNKYIKNRKGQSEFIPFVDGVSIIRAIGVNH